MKPASFMTYRKQKTEEESQKEMKGWIWNRINPSKVQPRTLLPPVRAHLPKAHLGIELINGVTY